MGNPTLLLIAIMVLVMVVGTAMDMTPTILILTPVLMPVVKAAGIDPIYFGVLFIINNSIGLITPPVGTVLNVVAGVGRMKIDDVTKGVWPFMLAEFAGDVPDGAVPAARHGAGEVAVRLRSARTRARRCRRARGEALGTYFCARAFSSSCRTPCTSGSPTCAVYLSTTGLTLSRMRAISCRRHVVDLHALA